MNADKKKLAEALLETLRDRELPCSHPDDQRSTPEVLASLATHVRLLVQDLNEMTGRLNLLEVPEQLDGIFSSFAQGHDEPSLYFLDVRRSNSRAADEMGIFVPIIAEESKEFLLALAAIMNHYWRTRP